MTTQCKDCRYLNMNHPSHEEDSERGFCWLHDVSVYEYEDCENFSVNTEQKEEKDNG